MSLLIKALASAEKDKQVELNKRPHIESSANTSSLLELAPVGLSHDDAPQPIEADVIEKSQVRSDESSALSLAPDVLADNGLSLADEAGLSAPIMASRTKASTNKAKTKAGGFTSQSQSMVADSVAPAATLASHAAPVNNNQQKVAASVFVANQAVKTPSSKSTLVALGIAGALMIWLGLQGYQYIRTLTVPEVVVVNPALPAPQAVDMPINVSSAESSAALAIDQDARTDQNLTIATVEASQAQNQTTPKADDVHPVETEAVFSVSDNAIVAMRARAKKIPNQQSKSTERSNNNYANNAGDEAQLQGYSQGGASRAPMKLVSRTPAAGVDPILLAAYQAFSRGEDASAQQQYRQVLQRDVRNVDALLGMAAIAQRQGRDADAMGWYQKVLEIEPRNTIAQSAVVSLQVNTDVIGSESRIKNMLAQQPESANLHAALGNLYAEQNQWALAQAAYFNASRFAPNSADYAFNLAISLDQLGKSNLALAQYQRALELLNSSGGASPDRAQLEARINALQ